MVMADRCFIKGSVMKLLRIWAAMILALVLGAVPVFAGQGRVSAAQRHQAWTSCVITAGEESFVRLYSMAQNDREVSLGLDFLPDGGCAMTIFIGKREAWGERILKHGPYDREVQLRIDRRDIYHARAHVSEDADCVYVNIGAGNIDPFFVDQLKRGDNLRIMVFDAEEGVPRYSLRGFTSAYTRGMSLLGRLRYGSGDDRSYFRQPSPRRRGQESAPRPEAPQDDAMYF